MQCLSSSFNSVRDGLKLLLINQYIGINVFYFYLTTNNSLVTSVKDKEASKHKGNMSKKRIFSSPLKRLDGFICAVFWPFPGLFC